MIELLFLSPFLSVVFYHSISFTSGYFLVFSAAEHPALFACHSSVVYNLECCSEEVCAFLLYTSPPVLTLVIFFLHRIVFWPIRFQWTNWILPPTSKETAICQHNSNNPQPNLENNKSGPSHSFIYVSLRKEKLREYDLCTTK